MEERIDLTYTSKNELVNIGKKYLKSDLQREYRTELSEYDLFTKEEEQEYATQLIKKQEEMQQKHAIDKYINLDLIVIGYPIDKINLSSQARKIQQEYIQTLLKTNKDYKKFFINNIKNHLNTLTQDKIDAEAIDYLESQKYLLQTISSEDYLRQIESKIQLQFDYFEIKNTFISKNLRLVWAVAGHYTDLGLDFMDLLQEGNIGLIKAIDRFDVSKGYKFSTYATWWIRQTIERALTDTSRNIRIPAHLVGKILKLKKLSNVMAKELGVHPTDEELARELNLPLETVKEIKKIKEETLSLQEPIGVSSDSVDANHTLESIIMSQDNIEATIINKIGISELKNKLKILRPRDRIILMLRYGFDIREYLTIEELKESSQVNNAMLLKLICNKKISDLTQKEELENKIFNNLYKIYQNPQLIPPEGMSLESVGNVFMLTRERVRQIENESIKKLNQNYTNTSKIKSHSKTKKISYD